MDEEMEIQEQLGPLIRVAVVAPAWLQSALLVFLRSTPKLRLVACTTTVQVLLSLDLEQIPGLIIIETDKRFRKALHQIRRLKAAWPASNIIALTPHEGVEASMLAAGADEIVISGSPPDQLRLAISRFSYSNQGAPIEPLDENGL